MRRVLQRHGLVALEVALLVVVVAALAVDEFVGVPFLLHGLTVEQYRVAEFGFEAVLVLLIGLVSVLVTLILQRRLRSAESFLRVCGWCKRVSSGGTWIPFEEYLDAKYHESSSHGICEDCQARMLEKARERRRDASG